MGRVIFLNTLFYPEWDEQIRLDLIQENLVLWHVQSEYECREKTAYETANYCHRSYSRVRKTWKLIKNEPLL